MTSADGQVSGRERLLGRPGVITDQDTRTVANLRLGVGVVGTLLPVLLIAGNWLLDDKVLVPSSMSGSYYTSARNLFTGSLCALGAFLIGYRRTERQDRCTWFAGLCALVVAFAPTVPPAPATEPAWVSDLHYSAATALIATLGLFCLMVFSDDVQPGRPRTGSLARRLRAWVSSALESLRQHGRDSVYLSCGFVVFVAGALAAWTGFGRVGWSAGWPSLYCFEAIAVFAFGVAWIIAGLDPRIRPAASARLAVPA